MKHDDDSLIEEQRRDPELGAALAALPHPDLPEDMDARLRTAVEAERRHRRRRRSLATIAFAAALAALMLGGAALAGAFDSESKAPWPEPPLPAKSAYPTNAAGQTYGGEKQPLIEGPDLVRVQATNGKQGYSRRGDVFPDPDPMTDEESEEMTKRGLRGYTIPVYESDGVTQIGVFRVGGPGSQAVYGQADGTITMEADADGNIITTTVASDGTTTIETEALDGTVTTKTLTAAEAKRLKQETAESSPSPTWSPKPVEPPAWLPERMSQAARDAGDAHATAFWEPQNRCYLKRIEGRNSPESPYEQQAVVWLVVLHGDFRTCTWMYQVLGYRSHHLLSQGTSDEPFDTSDLPPLHGPINLGEE